MTEPTDPVGPRRLRDDPDFRWETGCDLDAEQEVLGPFDHQAGRARLLAAVAAGGVPSAPGSGGSGAARWWGPLQPLVATVAVIGAVGAAYVAGVHVGARALPEVPPPAIVAAPAVPAERPAPTVPADALPSAPVPVVESVPAAPGPVEPWVPEPRVVPGPVRARPAPVASPPSSRDRQLPADASPPAAPAALAPSAPSAPLPMGLAGETVILAAPSRSTVGPQLDAYDHALDQLERGEYAAARDGFRVYLTTWPDGDLRPEAQIGLLQALHGTGDASAAEQLAAKLQVLPEFSDRRSNILRLRAESLVVLGRCDEAVAVAADLPSRDQSDIRRACRSMRREGQ